MKGDAEMVDVLSFEINNQEFAVEVEYVEIVYDMVEIRPVPNSKKFIEGLINLRGRIVPVVDITKILNVSLGQEHKFSNILILKINEEEIGIFVDEVKNVLSVDQNTLENISSKNEIYRDKSKGVIKINNRLIVFLNITELMSMQA
ncbi:MAG TPA: chemotaxis protein CheW [Petrotogaceae bacterium]|jgi:purine-binding chemotaxis protein CheW|nr:chemotaxis protein CheW [Petrotogaceae bacterium]HOG35728.1 chemotaxis protein CheW [Petrotogaceae bacterium]HPX16043.1 chemotaxis protein CheW [Petrotogaceae bacterium]HQC40629.1 chemotaxis protein CheW [Petrotogaceae bacterium]HQF34148.1 chemotaxis protein CheW [Petrotogaceae bacterium]